MIDLQQRIGEIPDFPSPGILFRDLLPLLSDPAVVDEIIERFVAFAAPLKPDVILVQRREASSSVRRWLTRWGAALHRRVSRASSQARPGQSRTPWSTARTRLRLAHSAIEPGMRVVIHDDLLATGGTAAASIALALQATAVPVGACFVAELCGLDGRARLDQLPVLSLVEYPGA